MGSPLDLIETKGEELSAAVDELRALIRGSNADVPRAGPPGPAAANLPARRA